MIHRYAAMTLGLLIVAIAALAVSARRQRLVSVPFALTLLATVIVQAILGMLTVTWRLEPLIVTAHLVFGMTTLGMLWWLALSVPSSSWGATSLGGAGRSLRGGAAYIASAHHLALLALAALYTLRQRGLWHARLRAWAVLGALTLQLLIGISMVLRGFPLLLATAHTAGAALLLLAALALVRASSAR